jgi:UrcA family protein
MKTTSLHHKHLVLAAVMLAATGSGPALAQQTQTRWTPTRESITVRAAPTKNWRVVLTASHLGEAFIVSASMPVPYSDLNLAREPDAAEFGRRIHVAAHLVCQQLDIKYPPTQYPIVDGYSGYDCERAAANDGMSQANTIIASVQR